MPPASSGPCISQWHLTRQAGVTRNRWAVQGRGCRDVAIPCLLTAQREKRSGRRQSCASCLATPLQISILSQNIFSSDSDGFTGAGSGRHCSGGFKKHTVPGGAVHPLWPSGQA